MDNQNVFASLYFFKNVVYLYYKNQIYEKKEPEDRVENLFDLGQLSDLIGDSEKNKGNETIPLSASSTVNDLGETNKKNESKTLKPTT